ncbi:unnamed protein product [Adineta steineri]|uniref:Uncharacterized protein n=1 Tax=Adineta steineri TaxID=433720 RepID=A0A815KI70_9BILA|nr:unnamed protein product [Adineta steineri]CAF3964414.1 unnamed protein product [Adineta steineri]
MALGAAIIFLASYIYFSATTKAVVECSDNSTSDNPHTEQTVTATKKISQCSSFRFSRVRFLIILLISILLVVVIPFSSLQQAPFPRSYALNHLNQSIPARKPVNINLTRKFLSYWEQNNVALVIHFNQNQYQIIDFLTIYRKLFPIVIFTGPDPHSKVLHCPEGRSGLYAYACLSRVITLHPNYTGYLMSHFDVLPIFYNLEKKDLNRIWIPLIALTDPSKANNWHWPKPTGKKAFDRFFSTLRNSSQNNTLYSKYLDNYMRNVGKNLTSSFSDIFYLPKRFVSDWFVLTDLMLQNHLFLEIGFAATSLLMTSTTISKEIIQLDGENWNGKDPVSSLYDKNNLEYYHRIRHQSKLHQYFVEFIVRRSLIN